MADISITNAQFGLLTSVFLWVYGAFSPLGGYLADHYGRRRMILGSLVVWSGVTWLTGQMESLSGLFTVRMHGAQRGLFHSRSLGINRRQSSRFDAFARHGNPHQRNLRRHVIGGLGGWVAPNGLAGGRLSPCSAAWDSHTPSHWAGSAIYAGR